MKLSKIDPLLYAANVPTNMPIKKLKEMGIERMNAWKASGYDFDYGNFIEYD